MKKKRIIVFCAIGILLALVAFKAIHILKGKMEQSYTETHYIFDKNLRTEKTAKDFSDGTYSFNGKVTAETLHFFRFLEQKFAVPSIEQVDEHYQKVEKYLHSQFKEPEATKLFETYRQYLESQIKITNNKEYRPTISDSKYMLSMLYKLQSYRRDKLGKETADALFGSEVKENEYLIRRAIIIGENTLYGKDKESRLQKLKWDMWGEEAISIGEDSNPYNRYQFKLQLYRKDLSELGEKERQRKIEEFRKEFFSNEQVRKLRESDDQIAREKETMQRYRAAEKRILNLKDITQQEKEKKIRLLQNDFFGKEAEAFRRREAIRKGAEK